MDSTETHLTLIDYTVFSASLLIAGNQMLLKLIMSLVMLCYFSVLIGVYYSLTGGRQQTNAEYLLGNRQMTIFPVSISLMASFMSAITLLGVPSEIYSNGTQFFMINFSYLIGTPICAFVFLPVFFKMKTTSVYEVRKLFMKN